MKEKIKKYRIFILLLVIVIFSAAGFFLRNIFLKEDVTKKEIEKYNKYAEFYNNKIFEESAGDFEVYYKNNFTDKRGNFKEPSKINLIELNSIRQKMKILDGQIEKIEAVLSEKPEFKNVDNYIKDYVESIKEERAIAFKILDYYEKSYYKDDNYEGGMLLHSLYLNSSRNSKEKYSIYIEIMKNLIKNEKLKEIKRLEKKNRIAAVKMVVFINSTEEFSKLLFLKQDFSYTAAEISALKKIQKEMEIKYRDLKNVSGAQIEKEKYREDIYNNIRKYSDEITSISGKIIEKLEKGEEVFPLPYNYSVKYNEIISEYNRMIGNKK